MGASIYFCSCIHSRKKHLESYCVPGFVLSTGEAQIKRNTDALLPGEFTSGTVLPHLWGPSHTPATLLDRLLEPLQTPGSGAFISEDSAAQVHSSLFPSPGPPPEDPNMGGADVSALLASPPCVPVSSPCKFTCTPPTLAVTAWT